MSHNLYENRTGVKSVKDQTHFTYQDLGFTVQNKNNVKANHYWYIFSYIKEHRLLTTEIFIFYSWNAHTSTIPDWVSPKWQWFQIGSVPKWQQFQIGSVRLNPLTLSGCSNMKPFPNWLIQSVTIAIYSFQFFLLILSWN